MPLPVIFAGLAASLNIYIGFRFFLNLIRVLRTSKYSKTATALFAVLFLCMGLLGFYFCFVSSKSRLTLWIGAGPWMVGLFILVFNMLTGDYK
jgi:hypothetical protein